MNNTFKSFGLLLVSVVMIVGLSCVTTDFDGKSLPTEPNISRPADNDLVELDPLSLDLMVDPYEMRIDVLRQKRTVTRTNANGTSMTVTEDVPYSPLGFRIGNGMVVDTNLNVGLDVVELFGLIDADQFSLLLRSRYYAEPVKTITRAGEKIQYKTLDYTNRATITDTGFETPAGFLMPAMSYGMDMNGAFGFPKDDPKSLFSIKIQNIKDGYEMPGIIPVKIVQKGDQINFGENLLVQKEGDSIAISASFLGIQAYKIYFKKTAEGYYIHHENPDAFKATTFIRSIPSGLSVVSMVDDVRFEIAH